MNGKVQRLSTVAAACGSGLLLVVLAACGSRDQIRPPMSGLTATIESTAISTLSPTATPSATALRPTATAMPTPEPTAAATPEPTPDVPGTRQALIPQLTVSPDGKWQVTTNVSDPVAVEAGEVDEFPTGEKYHVEFSVRATNSSVTWTAVDEWRSWGLGYTVPEPLQWSQDGRSLYFTNVPVPDGCSVYVNGGDLWRLDLENGNVTEIVPFVGLVLALSPDATQLAYAGSFGRGFILRDLATGEEGTIPLPEWSDDWAIGGLQWSPDGQRLLLTQVINPCSLAPTTAVVRVDVATPAAVTVVEPDERNFTILEWLRDDEVRLLDDEGRIWYLEVFSGELAGGLASE